MSGDLGVRASPQVPVASRTPEVRPAAPEPYLGANGQILHDNGAPYLGQVLYVLLDGQGMPELDAPGREQVVDALGRSVDVNALLDRMGYAAPGTVAPPRGPVRTGPSDTATTAARGSAIACLPLDGAPPAPRRFQAPPRQVREAFQEQFGRRVLTHAQGQVLATRVLQSAGVHACGDPVRQLQQSVGAFPDGKFGSETWGSAIQRFYNEHEATASERSLAALGELIEPAPAR